MKVIFVTFEKVNIEPQGEFLTIKIQNASKVFETFHREILKE